MAHNGEINTLLCNRNWMRAREAMLEHPIWGNEPEWLKPVIQPGGILSWRMLRQHHSTEYPGELGTEPVVVLEG